MRFRLMATYRGVPYEAGVGPSDSDVVLFAACPPSEELGFEPATGHWRKRVIRAEVDALWESRPVGVFRGEPCLILDDLGDRLHIAYVGTDAARAAHLGYWQIDRGVFELLTPRQEVNELTEERVDKPRWWTGPPAAAGAAPESPGGTDQPGRTEHPGGIAPGGTEGPGGTEPVQAREAPRCPPDDDPGAPQSAPDGQAPPTVVPGAPAGGRRSARRQRVATRDIFCELADRAAIPRDAYALEAETDGAMCMLATGRGFEVFLAADGARHEVRSFDDEEAAYFYLFGVLVAEAIRNGSLVTAPSPAALADGS